MLELQDEYKALIAEKEELEKEIVKLKAWDAEKANYQPAQLAPGIHAYVYQPKTQTSEPAHWICGKCYREGKKGVFQRQYQLSQPAVKCDHCDSVHFLPEPPLRQATLAR